MASALQRLQVLQRHLSICSKINSTASSKFKLRGVEISPPPKGLESAFDKLFTDDFVQFFCNLYQHFSSRVNEMLLNRKLRKLDVEKGMLPSFKHLPVVSDSEWSVAEIPTRLRNRKLDLGDISPAVTKTFVAAMKSPVQGVQTDFDDGHCPTWENQLRGLYNVYLACRNELPGAPSLEESPILMLRPRAWNMVEHNFMVSGCEVAGPLLDFALIMFHNGRLLNDKECGPFFYLSKLESSEEARLWNDLFAWTEAQMGLPYGCTKSCVLIENILAAFEMEAILYELRDHCIGLNCGIWDYSASIISMLGRRREFVIPDRNNYVNVDSLFLSSYIKTLVQVCHKRGALATGGMAALMLQPSNQRQVIERVCQSKLKEIKLGLDGFMVHDVGLVPHINLLWADHCTEDNQLGKLRDHFEPLVKDFLTLPNGGITFEGLKHNIEVAVLFIEAWLRGCGTFVHRGAVEDSATAEISRWQIWQWILFQTQIGKTTETVTRHLVFGLVDQFLADQTAERKTSDFRLAAAVEIFKELVTSSEPPVFITSYLNDHTLFRMIHKS